MTYYESLTAGCFSIIEGKPVFLSLVLDTGLMTLYRSFSLIVGLVILKFYSELMVEAFKSVLYLSGSVLSCNCLLTTLDCSLDLSPPPYIAFRSENIFSISFCY